MFLIAGITGGAENAAVVTLTCPHCGNTAAHRIVRRSRRISLFFIPLIPLGSSYHSDCTACGAQYEVPTEEAERMIEWARSGPGAR